MVKANYDDIGEGHSVMRKIDQTEVELKNLNHRLETLERNLQFRPMTSEERETMEKDVKQLKDVLKTQEENLRKLRSENRSTMMIAVVILVLTFLFYGIYSMMVQARSPPKF